MFVFWYVVQGRMCMRYEIKFVLMFNWRLYAIGRPRQSISANCYRIVELSNRIVTLVRGNDSSYIFLNTLTKFEKYDWHCPNVHHQWHLAFFPRLIWNSRKWSIMSVFKIPCSWCSLTSWWMANILSINVKVFIITLVSRLITGLKEWAYMASR